VHLLASEGVDVAYGCAARQACPGAPISRLEMAVLVAGAMAGSDAEVPEFGTFSDSGAARTYDCRAQGAGRFSDVAAQTSACRHVNYLWARGVIDGYVDGRFGASDALTRAQMARFVVRAFGLSLR
jgi:hypothetical protein